jgi:small-conductance mechanosensitive channel
MEKYAILLGYFDKQLAFIKKLYSEVVPIDLSIYDKRFLFAMRVQQFYTALEDLMKQIAKSFENHIDNMSNFHRELLTRMNTEVPNIRPAVLSHQSLLFLDKLRAFRHFIRHAYDCELDEKELQLIQEKLKKEYSHVESDLQKFRLFVQKLSRN